MRAWAGMRDIRRDEPGAGLRARALVAFAARAGARRRRMRNDRSAVASHRGQSGADRRAADDRRSGDEP